MIARVEGPIRRHPVYNLPRLSGQIASTMMSVGKEQTKSNQKFVLQGNKEQFIVIILDSCNRFLLRSAKTSFRQLPEIVSSGEERVCHQNVDVVVKREVKLDVPEIKTRQNESILYYSVLCGEKCNTVDNLGGWGVVQFC